jgi:hypothetical protein
MNIYTFTDSNRKFYKITEKALLDLASKNDSTFYQYYPTLEDQIERAIELTGDVLIMTESQAKL